jgi:hypothetical protein
MKTKYKLVKLPPKKRKPQRVKRSFFDSIKVISIVWVITFGVWGVGGKMLYDRIQELVSETKEMRKEIMVISNFVAANEVRNEAISEGIKENRNRINELYRILNR